MHGGSEIGPAGPRGWSTSCPGPVQVDANGLALVVGADQSLVPAHPHLLSDERRVYDSMSRSRRWRSTASQDPGRRRAERACAHGGRRLSTDKEIRSLTISAVCSGLPPSWQDSCSSYCCCG